MAKKMQLHGYSYLDDDPFDIGPPSENFDEILELGSMLAEGRPGLIVFVDPLPLQKWEAPDVSDVD